MRLLNTESLTFEEFIDPSEVKYAILSHTWEDDELNFRDIEMLHEHLQYGEHSPKRIEDIRNKQGYHKAVNFCKQASQIGLQYAWIDTCCIDKRSSAELSEAINSMFRWYKMSTICIIYLSDVQYFEVNDTRTVIEHSSHARWFTRGWTLQEFLAPDSFCVFAQDWLYLGDMSRGEYHSEGDHLSEGFCTISGIPHGARTAGLNSFPVAERFSWMGKRKTTRIEDMAYALLGIFSINMPLLYGEGGRAFRRLQEQIIESNEDYSIFAWNQPHGYGDSLTLYRRVLAPSPAFFGGDLGMSFSVRDLSKGTEHHFGEMTSDRDPPSITSRGIKMMLEVFDPQDRNEETYMDPYSSMSRSGLLCPLTKGSSSDEQLWLCVPLLHVIAGTHFYLRGNGPLVIRAFPKSRERQLTLVFAAR